MSNAKVISNHLLIDPVAAVFERSDPEYQPLRRTLVSPFPHHSLDSRSRLRDSHKRQRREILTSIATADSTRGISWIFTDQQSSNDAGSSTAKEYHSAAISRGSYFISIVLTCAVEENYRRAISEDRGKGSNTKLTDLDILCKIREGEDIFHFGGEMELELDITDLSPTEAASKAYEHICKVFRGA